MKKTLLAFLCIATLLSTSVAATADDMLIAPVQKQTKTSQQKTDYTINVNGERIKLGKKKVIVSKKQILVPARIVAQALGFTVTWDKKNGVLHLDNGSVQSDLTIGSDSYYTSSSTMIGMTQPESLGVAPKLIGNTTYVPVEFFNLLLQNPDAVTIKGTVIKISNPGAGASVGSVQEKNPHSKDYAERNPIFLCGGVEENGRIRWTQPELILYDDDPQTIISYPDLIEDQGQYFISETQKVEARVHEVPAALLEGLWAQFTNDQRCDEGLLLDAKPAQGIVPMPHLPTLVDRNIQNPAYGSLDLRAGFTLELELNALPANTILLDAKDAQGRGVAICTTESGSLHFSMCDGRTACEWTSDPLYDGPHHAVLRVDGGPKVISFVIDGILHDGDGRRQYGWCRYNPYFRDANGAAQAQAALCVDRLRVYSRALTTSEAVGNYRAYAKLPTHQDYVNAGFPFGETACHLPIGDRTIEWRRTQADLVVYLPKNTSYDNDNEHLLVFVAPSGQELLALWTQSSVEGKGDNHLVLARSPDGVRWSAPTYLAGAVVGGEALQASWGFPIVTERGRLYVFYTKEQPASEHKQHGGTMNYLYSDDNGVTFTHGKDIPMPRTAHDHPDPAVPKNWIVWQKPVRDAKGRFIAGYTLWSSTLTYLVQPNWVNQDSWTYFMRFENLDAHPEDIVVTWLPETGGVGVPNAVYPDQSACQEPATVLLPDGRLFSVMRTMTGHPYYIVSDDDGATFTAPAPLTYDDGTLIDHPMSPCPLYRLEEGLFLFAYHDNPGVHRGISQFDKVWTGNHADAFRNPIYLLLGRFDKAAVQPIAFPRRPIQIGDTDDIAVGPKRTAEVGTYPSVTHFQGRTVFWYPDRKFYLLGKYIDQYIEKFN